MITDAITNEDMAHFDMVKCLRISNPLEVDEDMQQKLKDGLDADESIDKLDVRLVVISNDDVNVIEHGIVVERWNHGQLVYKESSEREDALIVNDLYVANRITDCITASDIKRDSMGHSLSLGSTVGQLIHYICTYFETNGIDKEKYMKLVYRDICSRLWMAFREHNEIPY